MAKTENLLDISHAGVRRAVRSQTDVRVPRYSLYGDSAAAREWFVNVEPLDQRASALDWNIEPHTHPRFTQLVFVLDGSGEMTLDGDLLPFASPCILVVPPFRIHGFRYAEQTVGSVLTIENNYLGDLIARAPDLRHVLEEAGVFRLSEAAQQLTATYIVGLRAELDGGMPGGAIAAEIQLLQTVLVLLRDRPKSDFEALTPRAELIDRFKQLVEERYRSQPDLEDLAAELGVTGSQLRAACRATTGMTPLAILHDRIIAEAKRCLIYTVQSITEIAYSLGFEDSAYFSRFFTKRTGITPSHFRKS